MKGKRGQGIWWKGREGSRDRGRVEMEGDMVQEERGKGKERGGMGYGSRRGEEKKGKR